MREADVAEGDARLNSLFSLLSRVRSWAQTRVGVHLDNDRRRFGRLLQDGVVLGDPDPNVEYIMTEMAGGGWKRDSRSHCE